ncbi:hypothetical protein [Amaricoccus sp.]|uniref:hypothetical protein n=1 Tax=Amaricoccus sp. TaxID=1872485 RepID=UPI00261426EB|nr:hypothetical protein [uncultured Amaricoccus sp.]
MKSVTPLVFAALLLAACTVGSPIRQESPDTGRSQGGGSAGSRGPLYCQTVPADVSARSDWYRICFPDQ